MINPATDAALELLRTRKAVIVSAWTAQALATYSADSCRFAADDLDPFRNPVGHAFRHCLAALFDELVGCMDPERVAAHLDAIVRIRAVQELPGPDGLAFLRALHAIIRRLAGDLPSDVFRVLEERIEILHRTAAKQFAACRDSLAAIGIRERARRSWVQDRMQARRVMGTGSGSMDRR